MADFTSSGWSIFIMVVTALGIAGCLWLTLSLSKGKAPGGQVETTGHKWDDTLEEFNNPLPRWWVWLFYGQYEAEVKKADEAVAPLFAQYLKDDIQKVAADPQAKAMGERMYQTYCVQCHGADARGSKGFPNLADNDWLWGGDGAAIEQTLLGGRNGVMPPMGAAVGSAADVEDVANFVLSLSGSGHDAVKASRGKEKFVVCAACHGPDGKGMAAVWRA